MGISRGEFARVGGFGDMRFGEDVDFSMRLIEHGCKAGLIADAFVYHKRRTTFKAFFKQVYNSGIARINLEKRHPGTMKLVHALPAAFFLGNIGLIVLGFLWWPLWCLLALPALAFFADALVATKELRVALLAVPAAYVQLGGYGCGFCECFVRRVIFGKGEFTRFVKNFYKK
ncbi:MAG: glycosyl transferase family 2, partial [Salinivirgaceae bacterium]|nr:glycosyl transferase family 2 [Salinivirgaceae bacterium]